MTGISSSSGAEAQLKRGVAWNGLAFALMGLAGLGINLCVARYYAPWALGVFNTVLAIFIVGGQLASLGAHYSAGYHGALMRSEGLSSRAMLSAALRLSLLGAVAVAALLYALRDMVASVADEPRLSDALLYVLPGLLLLPANKVLLSFLNGVGRQRQFALGNSIRAICLLGGIVVLIGLDLPGEFLSAAMALAELLLFPLLLTPSFHEAAKGVATTAVSGWWGIHTRYGLKVLPAGVLHELNTRLDVLILGVMTNSTVVGVYSLAATFAEGLYQLLLTLRFGVDPLIPALARGEGGALRPLLLKVRGAGYVCALVVGVISCFAFPWVLDVLVDRAEFSDSSYVYWALTAGVMLVGGYVPLSGVLQQSGRPGLQSIQLGLMAMTNAVACLLFVPIWGALGAAVATACAQLIFAAYLKWACLRYLEIRV